MDIATTPYGYMNPQIEHWLSRIKYKRGWTFDGSVTFTISVETLESSDRIAGLTRGTFIIQRFGFMLPMGGFEDEAEFRRWLLEKILWIEMHELREFFRVDDKQIYDPHQPTSFPFWITSERGTFQMPPVDGGF
jgi:hypothetical protein